LLVNKDSSTHGTFNGVHLNRICSITAEPAGSSTLTTIRGFEEPAVADLERFQLNMPARLILSDAQVEGVLIAFTVDVHGYRITIESPADEAS
jgi:hypothetical protein